MASLVMSARERFDTRWVLDPWTGCWLWTAGKSDTGYGAFRADGRQQYAHRVSWKLGRGPIPDGLCVLHQCDTPACVNPDHLFLGTKADNAADRDRKGRHGSAKLSEDTVRVIRAEVERGASQASLARHYGVHKQTIWRVVHGKKWRHVQ